VVTSSLHPERHGDVTAVPVRASVAAAARSATPAPRRAGGLLRPSQVPVQRSDAFERGAAVPVQRAVGFEFEVVPKDVSEVFEIEGDSKSKKKDSKEPLLYLDDKRLAYLSADNGNVEYVTRPLRTRDDVKGAVSEIQAFHINFGKFSHRGRNSWIREIDGEEKKRYEVRMPLSPSASKPQATIGVGMEGIGELFASFGRMRPESASADAPDKRGPGKSSRIQHMREDKEAAENKKEPARKLQERVGQLAAGIEQSKQADIIITEMLSKTGVPAAAGVDTKKAQGFVAIIFKTAYDAETAGAKGVSTATEDPKYFFSLMPRTDFISMLNSIDRPTRQWLTDNLIKSLSAGWLDEALLKPYKLEKGQEHTYVRLTRRQWLDSIFNPGKNFTKDLLSPPPGYHRHDDPNFHRPGDPKFPAPEGIGAMGTDTDPGARNLSLFELRDLGGELPVGSWLDLALLVTDVAAEATHDDRLKEKDEVAPPSKPKRIRRQAEGDSD
jgi:hypothetical protein